MKAMSKMAYKLDICQIHVGWDYYIQSQFQYAYTFIQNIYMKTYLLRYKIPLFLIFLHTSYSAWVVYYSFDGYIPSYTYEVNLQAGDQLNATLSWPGTEDLDTYLYADGSDLLSNSGFVDRQYSSNLNPEFLIFTIPTTKKYYLRVDLYGSQPTPYRFEIKVNGVLIGDFYDTVYKVSKGKTAKQFSVSNTCTVKVQYNGPIYPIYLFSPSADLDSGSPTASNSSNVNPKELSATLSSAGTWTIIIHHSILSKTFLVPFSVQVLTDDANPCTNLCTNIDYAVSLFPGRTDICVCEEGFDWNSGSQKCIINCALIADAVSRIGDHQCSCTAGFTWDSTNLICKINVDCSTVSYADGSDPASPSDTCLCQTGFVWDSVTQKCYIDCSLITYAVSNTSIDQCSCDAHFIWVSATKLCEIDCSAVAYAAGDLDPIIDECSCDSGFDWIAGDLECVRDCSVIAYSTGTLQTGTVDECVCDSKFTWDSTDEQCQIDCSSLSYASFMGPALVAECACDGKFSWSSNDLECIIDCSSLSYATNIQLGSYDSCDCDSNFIWSAPQLECFIDCTSISHATVNDSQDTCTCDTNFNFDGASDQCVIDCSLISYATMINSPAIDQCLCAANFVWSSSSSQCIRDCSLISYATVIKSGTIDECDCQSKFSYDIGQNLCIIDCGSLAHTIGLAGASVDECSCVNTKYDWDSTELQCVIDCSSLTYTSGSLITSTFDQCECSPSTKFGWSSFDEQCMIDCSSISNAITNISQSQCSCDAGYVFASDHGSSIYQCERDCSVIPYADSVNAGDITECICQVGFVWQSGSQSCVRDCSMVDDSSGVLQIGSIDQCVCDAKFSWDSMNGQCQIDCPSLDNTDSNFNRDSCSCQSKYIWSSSDLECTIDCPSLSNAIASVPATYDQCTCQTKFLWNSSIQQCDIDCSTINNATQIPSSIDSCQCDGHLIWGSSEKQCLQCAITCNCYGFYPAGHGAPGNPGDLCTSVCGDGYIVLLQQCDDGNTNDYDGCSSLCAIQDDFTCINQPSDCSYDGDIDLSIISYDRAQNSCNGFQFSLQLSPILEIFAYTDFLNPVQQILIEHENISITQIAYEGEGRVLLRTELTGDVSETTLTLRNQLYGRTPIVIPFQFSPLLLPIVYTEEQCDSGQELKKVATAMVVVSYIVLGFSVSSLSNKIVGIQLFGVLQLAYFNLANHYQSVNIFLKPLAKLSVSNGPTVMLFDEKKEEFHPKMPEILRQELFINGYYINNINIMFFLTLTFLLVTALIYVIASKIHKHKMQKKAQNDNFRTYQQLESGQNSKVAQYAQKIGKQGTLTLILFTLFQISFCTGVFFKYCQNNSPQNGSAVILSYIAIIGIFAIILGFLVHFLASGIEQNGYGQFKNSFMRNPVCRMYIPMSIVYRLCLGFYISFEMDFEQGTLIVLIFSLFFVFVNLANLPFESTLHNYRSSFIHITQFVILFVTNYYRSMKSTTPSPEKGRLYTASQIQLFCICFCIVFSLIVVIYEVTIFVKKMMNGRKDNRVRQEDSLNLDSSKVHTKHQILETNENLRE